MLLAQGVKFGEEFPKTGGGEDIALCLDTVATTGLPLRPAPRVRVIHPWWQRGNFSSWRFFRWTTGDSLLINRYPEHAYYAPPNVVELLGLVALLLLAAAIAWLGWGVGATAMQYLAALAVWLVVGEVAADLWHYTWVDATVGGEWVKQGRAHTRRLIAAVAACLVRNHVELGHLWTHMRVGNLSNICRRFDWRCGLDNKVVRAEVLRGWRKLAGMLLLPAMAVAFAWVWASV